VDGVSLTDLAHDLAAARQAHSGRGAHTRAGGRPACRCSPAGCCVTAGTDSWDGGAGDLLVLPLTRHDLTALEDSAVLLTVVAGSRG